MNNKEKFISQLKAQEESKSVEEFLNTKAKNAGFDDEDNNEHFSFWLDCSDFFKQKKILIEWINEYAQSHQVEMPGDEEMNQKAIEYGKLKAERRINMTDYQISESEIDFLRGYNSAVREIESKIK